jgi:hypothetical protein
MEVIMRKVLAALLTIVAPLSAHATTIEQFSFSYGAGIASGAATTSCGGFVSASVYATRTGTHNLSAPSSTGLAFGFLSAFNCSTGEFFSEYGSTTNFQFSAPGAPNVVPQSVTASGVIPMSCIGAGCSSSTDNLTFSMALKPIGTMTFQSTLNAKSTNPTATFVEHIDSTSAYASGPVTVSSQNLGTIPASWFTEVSDERNHTVTISH